MGMRDLPRSFLYARDEAIRREFPETNTTNAEITDKTMLTAALKTAINRFNCVLLLFSCSCDN